MQLSKVPVWSKLPTTGTTIFTIMSQLAQVHKAINLSQGFPDFDCSPELMSLVYKYMKKGHNQYAPMAGVMKLREQIAQKATNAYGLNLNPLTNVTVTAGATQAIYTAITALIRENDEVIVFEPAYDSYVPAIQLNGGKPIYVQLEGPDYHIPWQHVKKLMNSRTKMIILNTPHNPTGAILTAADMDMLENIVRSSNILILGDEVYEHIVFDKNSHHSLLRYPNLWERSLITCSFGKIFHITGWKVGYCLGPSYLMKEFRKVHQYITFSVNTPVQHALAEYLQNEDNYHSLANFYQEKRDYFIKLIQGTNFKFQPSKGSYFQLLDYSNITDERDKDFAIRLTKEFGVASIPISVFYNNKLDQKMLRFCFAKQNETLEKAAERLHKL